MAYLGFREREDGLEFLEDGVTLVPPDDAPSEAPLPATEKQPQQHCSRSSATWRRFLPFLHKWEGQERRQDRRAYLPLLAHEEGDVLLDHRPHEEGRAHLAAVASDGLPNFRTQCTSSHITCLSELLPMRS